MFYETFTPDVIEATTIKSDKNIQNPKNLQVQCCHYFVQKVVVCHGKNLLNILAYY